MKIGCLKRIYHLLSLYLSARSAPTDAWGELKGTVVEAVEVRENFITALAATGISIGVVVCAFN